MWNLALQLVITTSMPMGIKRGRVVPYHEGLPVKKPYDLLITWFLLEHVTQ